MSDPVVVEIARGALIARLLPMSEMERAVTENYARKPVTNWRGLAVGEMRVRLD